MTMIEVIAYLRMIESSNLLKNLDKRFLITKNSKKYLLNMPTLLELTANQKSRNGQHMLNEWLRLRFKELRKRDWSKKELENRKKLDRPGSKKREDVLKREDRLKKEELLSKKDLQKKKHDLLK